MSTLNKRAGTDPAVRASIISTVRQSGRAFTHAAIAGLAHELALRFDGKRFESGTHKALVESTGFDGGNVSRVMSVLRASRPARNAALKFDVMSLKPSAAGVVKPQAVEAAAAIGKLFTRAEADKVKGRAPRNAGGTGSKTANKSANKGTDAAILESVTAWLMSATDDEFEGRKSLLAELLAAADDKRAEAAAAA